MVRALASHARGHRFEFCSLHQKAPDFARNQVLFITFLVIIGLGQNLGQGATQTVTHTPKGHNGADSIGRLTMGGYERALDLWRSKNITTDADLAEVLNAFGIAFAYHSGKIENENVTYHDTREIFEHDGVTAYTGDLRTLFEIRNAKEAYEIFLCVFQAKRALDEAFLKELQFCLTKNTYDVRRWQLGERPGEYKRHDYVTGWDEVGAAPEDAADEVQELLEELRDVKPENVLTAAAYFHAKFENIHPFADGNGRVGRLAMNYLLVLHGHPPIIIHEEDRKEYYAALEAWDTRQKLVLLREFLKWQTEKTWEKADCTRGESEWVNISRRYFICSTFVLFDYPTGW